jgi:hypothetical protein
MLFESISWSSVKLIHLFVPDPKSPEYKRCFGSHTYFIIFFVRFSVAQISLQPPKFWMSSQVIALSHSIKTTTLLKKTSTIYILIVLSGKALLLKGADSYNPRCA